MQRKRQILYLLFCAVCIKASLSFLFGGFLFGDGFQVVHSAPNFATPVNAFPLVAHLCIKHALVFKRQQFGAMATGGDQCYKISKSAFSELCECVICLDTFTDPVTLPCNHNFCRECITNLFLEGNEKTRSTFLLGRTQQCPSCREDFHNSQLRPFTFYKNLMGLMDADKKTNRPESKDNRKANTETPSAESRVCPAWPDKCTMSDCKKSHPYEVCSLAWCTGKDCKKAHVIDWKPKAKNPYQPTKLPKEAALEIDLGSVPNQFNVGAEILDILGR